MTTNDQDNYDIHMVSFRNKTHPNAYNVIFGNKKNGGNIAMWHLERLETWIAEQKARLRARDIL